MEKIIEKINSFLTKEKIFYKNIEIYTKAFSHTSYINEIKSPNSDSYERLEFLGDAILGKIVSEYIFKKFRELNPGEMSLLKSKVVSKSFLSKIGKELNLEKYVLFGGGDNNQYLSDSVYEDLFEALVAAIYLDLGEKAAEIFIYKHISSKLEEVDRTTLKDFKTKLQELLQSEKRQSVEYKLLSSKRIKNDMWFKVNVLFDSQVLAFGEGRSKKEAEQKAAESAYLKMVVK